MRLSGVGRNSPLADSQPDDIERWPPTDAQLLRRHRQTNRELASVPEASACSGDAATMAFDQTAHQGEPDT
ncbi:MAG: hypothetical protein JWO04_2287, partial [Gammaproteobacteria bacterium]|nr:hypothetical protein [Gammaproteobacteria bacterium]